MLFTQWYVSVTKQYNLVLAEGPSCYAALKVAAESSGRHRRIYDCQKTGIGSKPDADIE